jgi:hypothetical protein
MTEEKQGRANEINFRIALEYDHRAYNLVKVAVETGENGSTERPKQAHHCHKIGDDNAFSSRAIFFLEYKPLFCLFAVPARGGQKASIWQEMPPGAERLEQLDKRHVCILQIQLQVSNLDTIHMQLSCHQH